jgi:hypothetical protein
MCWIDETMGARQEKYFFSSTNLYNSQIKTAAGIRRSRSMGEITGETACISLTRA